MARDRDDTTATETVLALDIEGLRRGGLAEEGYEPVELETSRGPISLRFYQAPGSVAAALFVGGAGGGWDTPGRGRLYPDLCADLAASGVGALRVRYREPNFLEECALDVLAGLHFLAAGGTLAAAVVGHSFGGAVVAQAAAHSELVRAAVLLSTQSYGVDAIAHVSAGCATFAGHGTADEVLPPSCSRHAFGLAPEPKRLRLYEGARHGLDEAAEAVHRDVREWVLAHLPPWDGADEGE